LNNSFQVTSGSSRRAGVSHGQIVILNETLPGEFHGHVPTWEYICSKPHMRELKNELIRRKLVNKRGKILCR